MLIYKFKNFTLECEKVSEKYWYIHNYTIKKGEKVVSEIKRQSIFNNVLEEWYRVTKLKYIKPINHLNDLKFTCGKDTYVREMKWAANDWSYYEFVPFVEKELLTVR